MPSRSRRTPARVCGKEGNGKKHRNRSSAETDQAASTASACPRQLLASKNINATVVILRGFLSPAEIKQLRTLGPAGMRVGEDRHPMLSFVHEVWRFEKQLEEGDCALFNKLIGAMHDADAELWRSIPAVGTKARSNLHPEVEFIRYDTSDVCGTAEEDLPHIAPHIDNSSAVTLIGMLSEAGVDYEGGFNRFELGDKIRKDPSECGGIAEGRYREERLGLGDVLMFRGETCEHSLTAVTQGCRNIVQIELCRNKEGRH